MYRRLKHGAYGPLLGSCVLIAVLWAGSYRSFAVVQPRVSAGATRWDFVSYRGLLAISVTPDYPAALPALARINGTTREHAARWDDLYWAGTYGGFCAEDGHAGVEAPDGPALDRQWYAVVVPYWLLMVFAAAGPALTAARALRARVRAARGECGRCGYEMVGDVCAACAARAAVIGLTPRTHLMLPRL